MPAVITSAKPGVKMRARVILADDHPDVLESLLALVEPEFDVVATVRDGNALVAAAAAFTPDVIVTDIAMPGLNGISAADQILRSHPATRVVFVTVHNHPVLVEKGLATGALGYVLKPTAGDELVPAIHDALRGQRYVSSAIGNASK